MRFTKFTQLRQSGEVLGYSFIRGVNVYSLDFVSLNPLDVIGTSILHRLDSKLGSRGTQVGDMTNSLLLY